MGLLPVVPPEHVHEAGEQGHLHVVIHRHLKTHGLEPPAGHHSTVDDDDGPVLTLTTVYTVPALPLVASPPPRIIALIEPPKGEVLERWFTDVDLLIHGPPRAPTPPRAPPSFLSA